MSFDNFTKVDPFADTGDDDESPKGLIHIRIQQRNGRKTLTTLQGLPKEYDPKRLLKQFKKDFSTNGNVVNDTDLGEVIQVQGDQRVKICDFLASHLGLKKDNIKIHGF